MQFQGISPMQLNGPYGDAQAYIPTRGCDYYEKPDSHPASSHGHAPAPAHTPAPAYPWGHDAMGSQFSAAPYSDSSYSTSINAFANPHTHPHPTPSPNPPLQIPPPPIISQSQNQPDPPQRELTPNLIGSIPDSWKAEGKQELLETLLQTISSCDEKSVAQVVGVVRASATPEAAVSGICQVLGISGQ